MDKPKVLYLTVKNLPFITMERGIKDREYREPSKWIRSRLIDAKTGEKKKYDLVCIRSGYHKKAPYMVCSYKGFEVSKKNYIVKYETGLVVNVRKGFYRILLGPVIRSGNVLMKELF